MSLARELWIPQQFCYYWLINVTDIFFKMGKLEELTMATTKLGSTQGPIFLSHGMSRSIIVICPHFINTLRSQTPFLEIKKQPKDSYTRVPCKSKGFRQSGSFRVVLLRKLWFLLRPWRRPSTSRPTWSAGSEPTPSSALPTSCRTPSRRPCSQRPGKQNECSRSTNLIPRFPKFFLYSLPWHYSVHVLVPRALTVKGDMEARNSDVNNLVQLVSSNKTNRGQKKTQVRP